MMSTAIMKHLGPYIKQREQAAEEKGRNEEKINSIVNTFKVGLSLNDLSQAFKISVNEVKEILRSQNVAVDD